MKIKWPVGFFAVGDMREPGSAIGLTRGVVDYGKNCDMMRAARLSEKKPYRYTDREIGPIPPGSAR